MRVTIAAAAMAMTTSVAMAGELEDAHRLAISGRDSYWNCLAQEYTGDSNKSMSGEDFTRQIASVCPSERQNVRVTLVDYLSMQFPNADAELVRPSRRGLRKPEPAPVCHSWHQSRPDALAKRREALVRRRLLPGDEALERFEVLLGKAAVQFANPPRLVNEGLVGLSCEFGLNLNDLVERAHARELLDIGLGLCKRLLGVVAISRRDRLKIDRRGG